LEKAKPSLRTQTFSKAGTEDEAAWREALKKTVDWVRPGAVATRDQGGSFIQNYVGCYSALRQNREWELANLDDNTLKIFTAQVYVELARERTLIMPLEFPDFLREYLVLE